MWQTCGSAASFWAARCHSVVCSPIDSCAHSPLLCTLSACTARVSFALCLGRRWQKYVVSPAPTDAPYFTLLLVNKTAAPSASRGSFEEVDFDNSCMGACGAKC